MGIEMKDLHFLQSLDQLYAEISQIDKVARLAFLK